MRLSNRLLLAALMFMPAFETAGTFAAPFDPKHVPADAKWVIHVDADAVRSTKTWGYIQRKLAADPSAQAKIKELEIVAGVHFPGDIHDVTLFGPTSEETQGVILGHVDADQAKLQNALQINSSYASEVHGQHDLVMWEDKGKHYVGCFYDKATLLMGQDKERVIAALDVLDGKAETLPTTSPLAAGVSAKGAGLLIYVAGDGLTELVKNKAKSPYVSQVDSAWLSLTESDKDLLIHATVEAKTVEAAHNMQSFVSGMKALVQMTAADEHADANAKLASRALDSLVMTVNGKTISADMPVPLEVIEEKIGGATQPAGTEP